MSWRRPTYKTVDGERIDGVWCHIWRRRAFDGEYSLEDLFVYADGAIQCGFPSVDPLDLAGLEKLLASGEVAVTEPGAPAWDFKPSKWLSRNGWPLTPDGFLLEVADQIEKLNGRPTSNDRCWEAVRRYRQDPAEPSREALREAYLRIPPHERNFALGDMDLQDRPLRVLVTDIGEPVDGDGPVVTEEMRQWARDYFDRVHQGAADWEERKSSVLYAGSQPTGANSTSSSGVTVPT
ncbi:hypothetical protein [Streptomyces sp. ISL-86]|uniref:DUF7639 domain-containing protein n=1 Tax=Streptomyces sp. ISL-86 TaxID=2819187 RepID=UPI001BE9EB9D|nr:hypothetical protein [Streptomyces sp. ISL-86]MBT2455224.1 hypothetical protein [Streptomyces sp. ISL-86]